MDFNKVYRIQFCSGNTDFVDVVPGSFQYADSIIDWFTCKAKLIMPPSIDQEDSYGFRDEEFEVKEITISFPKERIQFLYMND